MREPRRGPRPKARRGSVDDDGQTTGRRPIGNDDFYARAASELIRLLSAHTDRGQAYRVDFRLRPEGRDMRLRVVFTAQNGGL